MDARYEKSAGVILYYVDKGTKFLLLKYPTYWGFAKGMVEHGETNMDAALREVKEETGISNLKIIEGFEYKQKWFFSVNRELVKKAAMFFLGQVSKEEAEKTKISEEHEDFEWLSYEDALKRMKIKSNRDMLSEAYKKIESDAKSKKIF